MITFTGTIRTTGHSNVITIPKQYLKDEQLITNKQYTITIKEE